MDNLGFDGRVAVVTGAGRGLGRAYALLLAARGASVVVNDVGGSIEGEGSDDRPAAEVVAEIEKSGGQAVADSSDVSTDVGGQALVDHALSQFGRIDVLLNNAGIVRWAAFPELDADNLAKHLAVHVYGSFHNIRAAWPHMAGQGYGRIVVTTSTGMFGLPNNTSYATAKAAVVGLTRSLATAGRDIGIRINCIAPAALTRMAGPARADDPRETQMDSALVAPMAAFLAHERCPVSGEIYAAGAGRFARIFVAQTAGYLHQGAAPEIEDVAAHWDAINDERSYYVPSDLMDWSSVFMSHLGGGR